MTDTCVCCGQTVPEGRMVCPGCERKTEERCGQMESWGEKLVELEERAKSNSHRISDLEADNKALHQLTASVQVLAAKQQTVEENVQEINAVYYSVNGEDYSSGHIIQGKDQPFMTK